MPAAAVIVAFVVLSVSFPDTAESLVDAAQRNVVSGFAWYYVLVVALFLAFVLWVGLSRYGDIRLGGDDDEPEFSTTAWFAMLFAAGMGIGLVFWGVYEPLSHFVDPKPGVSGSPSELAQVGLAQTYVHWGVHGWAVYGLLGLALGYAIHRRGRPVSIRWAVEPLLGGRVRGRVGDVIDIAAVVSGMFGVATTLGFGALQMSGGFERVGIADATTGLQVTLIVVLTAVATVSAVSGLAKGVKWVSKVNMGLAGLLLVFVLIAGPTLFLLRGFVQSIGNYFTGFLVLTFDVTAFEGAEGEAWQAQWTTFFWGAFLSWAPLVGVFIARISKGRTVREFVAGVLGVPTLISFLWFAIMGGSAIHRELFGAGGLVTGSTVDADVAFFDLLDVLPAGTATSVGALVLIALFFVTSSDSGSFVLSMLSEGGHPNPPRWNRVFWSLAAAAVAIALLVTGGLVPLQTALILTALPFSIVMIGVCLATARAFHAEHRAFVDAERQVLLQEITERVTAHVTERLDARSGDGLHTRRGRPAVGRVAELWEDEPLPPGRRAP
ncbi:MAG TPA: BCCT family transporter [Acidimicrobiales bacterium]|nr:BCCT family transporter [Acidimicrobiales bacterium]